MKKAICKCISGLEFIVKYVNSPGQICTIFISPNLSLKDYRTRVYCSNRWTKCLILKVGLNTAQLVKTITITTYNKIPSIQLNISAFFIKSSNHTSHYKTRHLIGSELAKLVFQWIKIQEGIQDSSAIDLDQNVLEAKKVINSCQQSVSIQLKAKCEFIPNSQTRKEKDRKSLPLGLSYS